ncbi:cytochrome c oxidase accessory protein CcoG [Agitococcus lubricus]|uniref:Cytochrome c oxidase accessory protein FixG n=1 Tax=Agitococcus lubricus TaxID=1077255 RepID=A0A2T5IX26_9GAMM|nr:cytochrome c oxidase accessory protein CcoG [Agitococcus lubricus]PTQ88501.1 cytochrome c oxidase accessory protein FixG [Agitococcus lubricus]
MSHKIPINNQSPDPVKVIPVKQIGLHADRPKIFPRAIRGFYQNIRHSTMALALFIYAALPWLNWEGRQAVLFDLGHQHFYIFGWTFAPQDFFLLSWLLIIAAFALFVVTVFAGRVFCGYACPQTTWTALFLWIEKLTEGERHTRMKLDQAPMTANKLVRRSIKHVLWLLVSFATGFIFVGYFTPIRSLAPDFFAGVLGGWGYVFILIFTVFTYMNAGWLREQVCFYMCPYGRFQSVMFDKDTLIVSYDAARGESRGSRKKNVDPKAEGLGDCIDCQLCVQVCPTGIDIRDGLQLECIQCAACIDACNSIMDQMGYERGLVRYTTEHMLNEKSAYHWLRPRLMGYSLMLVIMACLFVYTLAVRVPLAVEAIRDRNQLFRENSEGLIENVYTLKIINKTQQPQTYQLQVEADEHIQLVEKVGEIKIHAGEVLSLPVTLQADPGYLEKSNYDIEFEVIDVNNPNIHAETESRFLAPASR